MNELEQELAALRERIATHRAELTTLIANRRVVEERIRAEGKRLVEDKWKTTRAAYVSRTYSPGAPLITERLERMAQLTMVGLTADQLAPALLCLTEREGLILEARFGLLDDDPQTLQTTAKRYGVTRERVRQIEAKALRNLRLVG